MRPLRRLSPRKSLRSGSSVRGLRIRHDLDRPRTVVRFPFVAGVGRLLTRGSD
jgi:hypothetical protein